MPRWGMVIDLDKCTGCQACVVACKVENNIPFLDKQEADKRGIISWIEVITIVEGKYPDISMRFLPRPCMHCDNPPCVRVCPVNATMIDEEGIVGQIYPRCIGCRYCSGACPYTAKYFNWSEPVWPGKTKVSLNPDVSVRYRGIVEKCTFCHHRLQKAKDKVKREKRKMKDGDFVPACVQTCPAQAMYFGDLEDKTSKVYELSRSTRAFKLLGHLGTKPKVIYLSEREWYIKRKEE